KAGKILEINPEHALFQALNNAYENDKDRLRDYAYLLYNQALLIEGFPIDNAEEYSRLVCELIAKSA
ncbi:MAG: molecular chaperone HtpG, partial [Erysipelotrichales bacterium]|nr:molecular chaperone HtpG [Erysipelotrichales bacterium]